jgi:hypothetical protein
MAITRKPIYFRILLPIFHTVVCLAIYSAGSDVGWWYLTVADFPLGIGAIMLAGIADQFYGVDCAPLLSFSFVGGVWWFALGRYADRNFSFHQAWVSMRRGEIASILPLLHLCICAASVAVGTENVEKVLFVADFPISWIVEFLFQSVRPLFSLGVLGTWWWYTIGRVAKSWRFSSSGAANLP